MIYVLITLVYLLGCVVLYFGPAFYGYEDLDDAFRFSETSTQTIIIIFWPISLTVIAASYLLCFLLFIIFTPFVFVGVLILEQMNNFRKSIYEKHKK